MRGHAAPLAVIRSSRYIFRCSLRSPGAFPSPIPERRQPPISIQHAGEPDCPEVVVEDESRSMVTVRVPLVLPDDCAAGRMPGT
ncbi:DUF5959 family protein [Streptomyces chryseus]